MTLDRPPRLAAKLEVSALLRRVAATGGSGAVLASGDAEAGSILLWLAERGRSYALVERRLGMDGDYVWTPTGPDNMQDYQAVTAYIERRRARDGDLWVVELDIAGVERFAAELAASG